MWNPDLNGELRRPAGVVAKDGYLYVSLKGGYKSRVVRYDLKTREREVLIDQLPQGGWHEPGGPVFGADGLMYFGQGSVSLNGVVKPAGFQVDIAKHLTLTTSPARTSRSRRTTVGERI